MSEKGYWQSLAEEIEEEENTNFIIPDNREEASTFERRLLVESDSVVARIFNNIMSIILSIIFVIAILYYAICVLAFLPGTLGSLYLGVLYSNILGGGAITAIVLWIIHAAIGLSIFPLLEDTDIYQ